MKETEAWEERRICERCFHNADPPEEYLHRCVAIRMYENVRLPCHSARARANARELERLRILVPTVVKLYPEYVCLYESLYLVEGSHS